MAVLDDLRRWLNDRFVTDEHITITPKSAVRQLEAALPDLSPSERQRNIDHLKYYAQSYYQGRHREPVPAEVNAIFTQLEREAMRLNTVDRAREVVESYGGPPTRQTIADALERSARERIVRLEHATASEAALPRERVSVREGIAPQTQAAAVAQTAVRARAKEVAQNLERVPNTAAEAVSQTLREPYSESPARAQNPRANKRELGREQGMEMGV